jgi:hypothetical protein
MIFPLTFQENKHGRLLQARTHHLKCVTEKYLVCPVLLCNRFYQFPGPLSLIFWFLLAGNKQK